MWTMFNIKGGCKSCDVMTSLYGPLFGLREDVQVKGIIFTLGHNWPYIEILIIFLIFINTNLVNVGS
jgi:hypothetical protein